MDVLKTGVQTVLSARQLCKKNLKESKELATIQCRFLERIAKDNLFSSENRAKQSQTHHLAKLHPNLRHWEKLSKDILTLAKSEGISSDTQGKYGELWMFKLPMGGLPTVPLQHLWTNGEPDDMIDAFEHARTKRKWFIIISPMIIPYVYSDGQSLRTYFGKKNLNITAFFTF